METVPKREIDGRVRKLQSKLEEMDLDGAFVLQNVDLFYFSGTIQSSVLFIPQHGEPILMVLKGLQRAQEESSLKQVFSLRGRGRVRETLRNHRFVGLKRMGLEMDVLPANTYLRYQQTFPECEWSDVSVVIQKIRMIKTPYEVDQIRSAARILHKGYMEIREVIREGMTELEIDGHLSLIARREGHMGILRMRGWNQEMTYAHVLSGESGATISFLNSPHGGSWEYPGHGSGCEFSED